MSELSSWILKANENIKMEEAQLQKNLHPDFIAQRTIEAMRPLLLENRPLTTQAGDIGKYVLAGLEDRIRMVPKKVLYKDGKEIKIETFHLDYEAREFTLTEKQLNKVRIKNGLHLLRIFFNKGLFFFSREASDDATKTRTITKKGTKEKIEVPVDEQYLLFEQKKEGPVIKRYRRNGGEICEYETMGLIANPMIEEMFAESVPPEVPLHTETSTSAPEREGFFSLTGGELVHKIGYDKIDLYTPTAIPIVYSVVEKLDSVAMEVNGPLLDDYIGLRDDDIFTLKNSEYNHAEKVGRWREVDEVLHRALKARDGAFYQRHFLDFRGRYYVSTNYFNHMASKMAKSLFLFANKQPIGMEGLFWLKVNLANAWGKDKLSLDGRADYIEDNQEMFMDMIENKRDKSWLKADSPFEFRAALREYYNAMTYRNTYEYESGLPIGFDMSCSGLQVYSALTLDELTAGLCKMIPGIFKDYYDEVGKAAFAILNDQYHHSDASVQKIIEYWLKLHGYRRDIAKRSAMTYLYSCGKKKMGEHIYDDFRIKYKGLTKEASDHMGDVIHASCQMVAPGAANTMKLIQTVGVGAAKQGRDFVVTGPYSGFKMVQDCRYPNKSNLHFYYGKRRINLSYHTDKSDFMNVRDVLTGSPPQCVHTLDKEIPTHLVEENHVDKEYEFLIQHDQFHTIPAKAGNMYEDIRTSFYDIFSDESILENIIEENQMSHIIGNPGEVEKILGEPEEFTLDKGNLKLDGIFEQELFCS